MLRKEYPRPDFVRQQWQTLNGTWLLSFDDENCGLQEEWYRTGLPESQDILVPFAYQSETSGIHDETDHEIVWYQRAFTVPPEWNGQRVLLNFGAVDYACSVWVNGRLAGGNTGGYTSFHLDITKFLTSGENQLVLRVVDEPITSQPRGKQRARKENFGCWYTPITGIWQSVWLETVGSSYIDHIKMETDIYTGTVDVAFWLDQWQEELSLECTVFFHGEQVSRTEVPIQRWDTGFSDVKSRRNGSFAITIPHVKLWTPEQPHLYDVQLRLKRDGAAQDEVQTYVGVRKIHADGAKVYLNDRPVYMRMVLDQGYWPGGIYTPKSIEEIAEDVQRTKDMGFNGARKHQKFEDPYYYYYCDTMGLLNWCEMPSAYIYDEDVSLNMTHEWQRLIQRHYNHPSVMAWVPLNESWGVDQLKTVSKDRRPIHHMLTLYHLTKSLDTTRLVVGNDGWQQATTDIIAIHDYTQDPADLTRRYAAFKADRFSKAFSHNLEILMEGFPYEGQPIMVTEFGGIKVKDADDTSWGYGESAQDIDDMVRRIKGLVDAILAEDEISGYCYTQLTDVQQEVNGLMTMDRQLKVEPSVLAAVFRGR